MNICRWVHRYAELTVFTTWLLLIAGGLVTSTDSGLAVPDWPLSYGTWFPPMVGGIVYEHGHRMIAGLVGLMILGLAAWLWRVEPRRWVRRLGYGALAAVAVQALLGGLTVLWLLPPQISIAHACLGQTVFCLIVALARATSPRWDHDAARWEGACATSLRRWSLAAALLAACQLLLGAIIRHTGGMVRWHVLGAVILTCAVAGLIRRAWRMRRQLPVVSAHAVRLGALIAGQLLVGIAVLMHRGSVLFRTGHVAVGALILAQAVIVAWDIMRRTRVVPGRGERWRDYLELTKPRLSSLVLLTTAVGYWLGRRGSPSSMEGVAALLGTAGVVAGANALNEWMECPADALMHRTQRRPLPAGRLSAHQAWRCGAGLIAIGLLVLTVAVNGLSALLAAIAAATYLFIYTPLKRRSSLCTLVGAIPGALPPMIGWAAARHALGAEAWILFAMLYLWQLPHFLAIATLYRDDYARAGFRMLPVIEPDGSITARQTVLAGLALVPVTLSPPLIGLGGPRYFYSALVLGLLLLGLIGRAALTRSRPAAQQLFLASVLYLPALLGVLAYDRMG